MYKNTIYKIVFAIQNFDGLNFNYPKKVITMDNFSGNTYQGIEQVNIREFLLG
jgi:hypothetical protein